jgi:outer membrane murein-binding lipoprotein Lpp
MPTRIGWPGVFVSATRVGRRSLDQAEPLALAVSVLRQVQDQLAATATGKMGGGVNQVGQDREAMAAEVQGHVTRAARSRSRGSRR